MNGLAFWGMGRDRLWRVVLLGVLLFGLLGIPAGSARAEPIKVGLVFDTPGGASDLSFNYMANLGLQRAVTELGIVGTPYDPDDATQAEYEEALGECVAAGNQLCIAVGYLMSDALYNVATSPGNSAIHFAIVDVSYDPYPGNVRGMVFSAEQAGYLAGSLAGAWHSEDVGVVGGMQIPPVVAFVEGFKNGAQCANGNLDVLINYTGTFNDPAVGEAAAIDMISRGAGTIFQAAGPTGNGAILYAAQHDIWAMGVDTDQYVTLFENGGVDGSDYLVTSAMKRVDSAVFQTIEDEVGGTFTAGDVKYGLDALGEDGVGLAPYHETDSLIPVQVKTYVSDVRQKIIDGQIDVTYGCRPRFHAELVENDVMGYDWVPGDEVQLTIDDEDPSVSPDVSTTAIVDSGGTVAFTDISPIVLRPGMHIEMTGTIPGLIGLFTKTLDTVDLQVTAVNQNLDTVWGTAPKDSWINVQRCDSTGCSWRRVGHANWLGNWAVAFSIPGGETPEEQQILDIVPGTVGEALISDADNDITDFRWSVENTIGGNVGVAGVTVSTDDSTPMTTTSDANGDYMLNVPFDWGGTITPTKSDCTFNPTATAYTHVIFDQWNQDYEATCTVTFVSAGNQDGWILESGENSSKGGSINAGATTLYLGDNAADKQYRSILSFNTEPIPDGAVMGSMTLKFKRAAIVGTSPFGKMGPLYADMKNGTFGTSALQAADFQTIADQDALWAYSATSYVGGWYVQSYIGSGLDLINKTGLTQFKLRFNKDDNNNNIADYLKIWSGNATASSRPQLIITYTITPGA